MAAASSESLAQAQAELSSTLEGAQLKDAKELFDVLNVLDDQAALRRGLTDPSRTAQQRQGLASSLLAGKVSDTALQVVQTLVAKRWSAESDLGEALAKLATSVAAISAEKQGLAGLNELESQLLQFNQTVASSHQVQAALTDPMASTEAKTVLAGRLSTQASPEARLLIDQAVAHPRGRKPQDLLAEYVKQIAARQQRYIAHVTVAQPLPEATEQRLAKALDGYFGRSLKLNVTVDPAVLGGMKIQVGDEVVDSSMETRLQDLKRKMAGSAH